MAGSFSFGNPEMDGALRYSSIGVPQIGSPIAASEPEAMDQDALLNNPSAETTMIDVGENYNATGQQHDGPYYQNPPLEPSFKDSINSNMTSSSFHNESEDISPTQAYGGDVSSEAITPSSQPKHTPGIRTPMIKPRVLPSDTESDSTGENQPEYDDDRDEDFEPEPFVPKVPTMKAAILRKMPAKTPAGSVKKSGKGRKGRKSAGKSKEAVPFNRQRRAPKHGITEARPIARSYEECDDADKALLDMRDKENRTWRDIRVWWEEMTGQKTGNSTLPNRYERLKDNFSIIREEDRSRLLDAKDEVEKEQAEQKWELIAVKVRESGGDQYTADHLHRQYKKLMLKEGLRPPPGIVDRDFDIQVSDDMAQFSEDTDE